MQKTNNHPAFRMAGLAAGLFVFCFFLCSACVERERSNILDPLNQQNEIDLNLSLSSTGNIIRLNWTRPAKLEFNRFIIYRRTGGQQTFEALDSVAADITVYDDPVLITDVLYEYVISVLGPESESAPTKPLSITPGPGNFWILDYSGFQIFRLTYDLQYTTINRGTLWRPWRMALAANENLALITYPGLHYIEILSTATGRTILESGDIPGPYDVIYLESENRFWVTDSSGSLVRVNAQDGQTSLINNQFIRPTQLCKGPDGQVGLLDSGAGSIVLLSASAEISREINSAGGIKLVEPEYFSFGIEPNTLFIIHHPDSMEALLSFNLDQDSVRVVARADNFGPVLPDLQEQDKIWIVEYLSDGSSLVQLSATGQRLSALTGFDYITDFLINPVNYNFVITDAGASQVVHLRRDQSLIGRSEKAYQPVKVYLE